MSEHARRRHRHVVPGPLPLDNDHTIGEEALHFMKWFVQSKYRLMGAFLGELQSAREERDPEALRARYCRSLQHAERVHRVRAFVTFLLALGVIAAAASAIANVLQVDAPVGLLENAAAVSTSLTVLLVALRLMLDRYLARVDVVATFLAIQLSCAASLQAAAQAP